MFTLERFLARVSETMPHEMAFLFERTIASFTPKRSFSGMIIFMFFQVAIADEMLFAIFTFKRFLRLVRVNKFVIHQRNFLCKCSVTFSTFMWFIIHVTALVPLQSDTASKCFFARVTFERLFT
jgi:hypothetical protein